MDAKRELYHPVRTDINLAEFEPAPQEFEDIESNFWWNHANKVIFLGTSFSLMLLLFVIKLTFAGSFESEDAFIALSGMLFSILLGAGISQRFGMEIRYRLVFKKYHESWRNDFCKRVLEAGRSWEEIEASINSPHDQNIPLNSCALSILPVLEKGSRHSTFNNSFYEVGKTLIFFLIYFDLYRLKSSYFHSGQLKSKPDYITLH